MDGGIAEIERQQGWSCKKRMALQKNQGPGPAKKMCPAKVKFWRMWPVAAGGQCPLPARVPHNFLLFTATQSTFQSYLYVFQILH